MTYSGPATPLTGAWRAAERGATFPAKPPARLIRVMLVVSNLEYGGAQRQIVEFINRADRGRFDVRICSLSHYVPLADQLDDRSRLHVIVKRWKFDASVVRRLVGLLREHRTDVVHGYLFDAEIAARLAGRWAGVPVVVGSERNTDYHIKPVQRLAHRLSRGCLDLVIANSTAGVRFHSREIGLSQERYRVVRNGVDLERFRPRAAENVRARIGIAPEVPVVGMFASLKRQKNHPLLLRAAASLVDQMPDLRILLVGDMLYGGLHGSDTFARSVHDMISDLGLTEHCVLLGNRADVEVLYPACDVTVLPSLFEGTPNVLLESMACGVPVIATDVADNRELVAEGKTGHLVSLDDTELLAKRLRELLSDRERRAAMAQSARAHAEREWSNARLAQNTEAVYTDALEAAWRSGKGATAGS